jgi:galactokinase
LALAISRDLLGGWGACRVHGGGFACTIQAFVSTDLLPRYLAAMRELFGPASCHELAVRSAGATRLDLMGKRPLNSEVTDRAAPAQPPP